MSYIQNSLGKNEEVVSEAKVHWWILVPPILLTLLTMGFLLPITLIWFLWALFYMSTTELGVTTKRVIAKHGILSRRLIEQRLEKMDSITVDQGIFGRMLDFGSVTVNGSGLSMTPLRYISNPMGFRQRVSDALEKIGK